ncbi:MAG: ribonuclease E/G, partial [Desulfatiglandales bacterium]
MSSKMLINVDDPEECRIAVIRDGVLDEFHIQTISSDSRTGNIYLGVVEKAEVGLQAFFINFGVEKNGFLPADEVHKDYFSQDPIPSSPMPLEKMLKRGQTVLVQVMKEMPGKKGDQLTTFISLAGRYLVLTPGNPSRGVSKKIEEEEERGRLKKIAHELPV